MAEKLEPCCQRAWHAYVERLRKAIVSYPVIKDVPCPSCKRIIKIRLYTPPGELGEGA